jgi:uracil-DNA glycosylase
MSLYDSPLEGWACDGVIGCPIGAGNHADLFIGGLMGKAADLLKEVAGQVAACDKCQLQYSRKRAVPGEGPANAKIMFIGEGPGFYENEQGRPFVGAAGQFLGELLAKIGMAREQVFITNVVKCRPPSNRDPQPEELAACSDYLERQIEAINPRVIVTLGRYSMARFLPIAKISDIHGQATYVRGRMVVAMFHPAAALHQPSLRPALEKDFMRLPEYIQQAELSAKNGAAARKADKHEEPPAPPVEKEEPKQLSLF